LKFEVKNGVKRWSMPLVTIHQCHEKVPSWQACYAKCVAQNTYEPL
jgi:hypothetical protein